MSLALATLIIATLTPDAAAFKLPPRKAPSTGESTMTTTRLSPKGYFLVKDAPSTLPSHTELATFGAGCFWGVEAEFRKQKGVIATAVGYTGGHTKNPTYKEVCTDKTGHAEVVVVEFDPAVTSFEKMIDLFWDLHDPTTLNRQGPDTGSQYRSAVFYHSPEQKAVAERTRDKLQASNELGDGRIVTEITPAPEFYKAEDYHQQYVEKGGAAACHWRRSAKH